MIGTTLHHYRIIRALGRGGMGEVYIAEDLKLHREVALKLLPREMAADAERLQRFQREAQAVAALNHPNVVTVYSVEEADGLHFITMELVEGKTLTDLIPKRGLPVPEFLKLSLPMVDAIAAAHQRGIVHRDLKPANIMVTAGGRLKVLDFGLAKLKPGIIGPTDARTLTADQLTIQHEIVGTPSYMSPEQAQGQPVDHRTDIFSAGVVMYEMVTGKRPFRGDSAVTILSSIIKDNPPPTFEVNPSLPQELDRIIMHCLAKDPAHRYQSASDLRNELEDAQQQAGSRAGLLRVAARRLALRARRKGWRVAALAAVALIAFLSYVFIWRKPGVPRTEPAVVETISSLTSAPGVEQYPSFSPDGQWLVYSGWESGRRRIFLQSVGGQNAFPITKDPNVDDDEPAFSPDGEKIAFRSNREGGGLFMMGRTGEAIRRLTSKGFNPGWSPDGTKIAFVTENMQLTPLNREAGGELWIVDIATEAMRRLDVIDALQPSWSPHDHRIAFAANSAQPNMHIWTIPVNNGTPTPVTSGTATDWCPKWSPDGKYLYFASDRGGSMNLWRVPMDEESGKPTGEPEAIVTPATWLAHPTISADGRRIAYCNVVETQNIQRIAFDPVSGKRTGEPEWITTGSGRWSSCDVSPDGQSLVFYSRQGSLPEGHLYIIRTDKTGLRRLTGDVFLDRVPRWSPRNDWITFFSTRSAAASLWMIHPDGSGLQPLADLGAIVAWSPDGTRIATSGPGGIYLIDPNQPMKELEPYVLPDNDATLQRLVVTSWSPDFEKLVCQSGLNETGSKQNLGIVTYSFKTGKYERLTDYGEWPTWLPDSRRILFVSQGNDFFIIDSLSKQVPATKIFSVERDSIGPPRIAPDGGFIYFTRRNTEGDIWLVTLR
jgi:serine/threonine protein kinase/Tol biopolymer transport system component